MPEPAAHRITADAVSRGAVDPGEPHDHGACIEDALSVAGRICADRGTQLTALRRRVLELIWASHRSVKAYDLLHQLDSAEKPAKPPTLYRAIHFLNEQGRVHQVDSQTDYFVQVGRASCGERLCQ